MLNPLIKDPLLIQILIPSVALLIILWLARTMFRRDSKNYQIVIVIIFLIIFWIGYIFSNLFNNSRLELLILITVLIELLLTIEVLSRIRSIFTFWILSTIPLIWTAILYHNPAIENGKEFYILLTLNFLTFLGLLGSSKSTRKGIFFLIKSLTFRYYLRLFSLFLYLQILSGYIYYVIYEKDNSSFNFIATDYAKIKTERLEAMYKNIAKQYRELSVIQVAQIMLKTQDIRVKIINQYPGSHRVNQKINIMNISQQDTTKNAAIMCEIIVKYRDPANFIRVSDLPGSFPECSLQILDKVNHESYSESPDDSIRHILSMDLARVEDRIADEKETGIIAKIMQNILADIEKKKEQNIANLKKSIKKYDQDPKNKIMPFDMFLYSLNVSSYLGVGLIVPNNLLTKFFASVHVIITIALALVLVNLKPNC